VTSVNNGIPAIDLDFQPEFAHDLEVRERCVSLT